jgi:hypothetical protein
LAIDLVALQSQTSQTWIGQLRNKANEYHQLAQDNPDRSLIYSLWAYLFEFCAGALPGFLGGCVTPDFGFTYAVRHPIDLN